MTSGARVGNWGRRGDGDERGAVDHVTPERVLAAMPGDVGGIATLGVLVDLTRDGERTWEVGELIEVLDLEEALGRRGLTVRSGDAVVIRTGWFDRFVAGDPRFDDGEPGLSPSATD